MDNEHITESSDYVDAEEEETYKKPETYFETD